mgnify:CR=1 FL=1|tara:strand:- start:1374 stop:2507 length:1134 start_codon:yes stop_codon:yes gene_type:complete
MKKLKFIDLFCGAGGLSHSFKKRGHLLKLALDIDPISIKTLKKNFPKEEKNIINSDIRNLFLNKSLYNLNKNIDVLMGGPPCQGFSTANRQNIINDPRNNLYKYFIKFAKLIEPKFILIENVVGIKLKANDILKKLDEIGYQSDFKILQAYDFGVPQNRKRLFFFAVKKGWSPKILNKFFDTLDNFKILSKKFVLKDALFGLRPLKPKKFKNDRKNEYFESGFNIERNDSYKLNDYLKLINSNKKIKYIYNHTARYNNERDIEIFKRLPQGGDSTHESIQDIMPYKNRSKIFKDKYFKLDNNKVSKTITSHMKFDCNMYIHPTQARGLSPREAARIQSFPDYYFFEGTKSQCYSQIGNAVPPLLSNYICLALEKIND